MQVATTLEIEKNDREMQAESEIKNTTYLMTSYTYKRKPIFDFIKRLYDIILSSILLIILTPVYVVVAIIIKKEDGGPIIYTQTRIGKNGKSFAFYKFRSMCVNADKRKAELQHLNEVDGPVFKIKNDPRITKIGKTIRKYSIDELPQVWNVLKGDMSLVGPRPPLPCEVEKYSDYERHRLDVKQGLTCYWQVSGRSNLSFSEWVYLDLKYINDRSVLTDVKLLFMTFKAVFSGDGAS